MDASLPEEDSKRILWHPWVLLCGTVSVQTCPGDSLVPWHPFPVRTLLHTAGSQQIWDQTYCNLCIYVKKPDIIYKHQKRDLKTAFSEFQNTSAILSSITKGPTSRFLHLEKNGLNVSSLSLAIRLNLLFFYIINHLRSCLVYYYLFGVFLP